MRRWLGSLFPARGAASVEAARRKFWTTTPSHRNAFELFTGRWASNLVEIDPTMPSVGVPLFAMDDHPRRAAAALGTDGRLDGMSVLELGPLEGAHCYQLENLGAARVVAIESNADSFLRCLVIKNALSLDRTTFLLGDCVTHLAEDEARYDLIFASGILYHMADPLGLIRLMALRTDKVFLWTQYYHADFRLDTGRPLPHRRVAYAHDGLAIEAWERIYHRRERGDFWGGIAPRALWLTLDDIVAAFRHYGLDRVEVLQVGDTPSGPCVGLTARRDG